MKRCVILIVACLLTLVLLPADDVAMIAAPIYDEASGEIILPSEPEPAEALKAAESNIQWEAEAPETLLAEDEFIKLLRAVPIDASLSNEDLFYIAHAAFGMPEAHHESAVTQPIVSELRHRLAAARPVARADVLYLYDAALSAALRGAIYDTPDAEALLTDITAWGEALAALYGDCELAEDTVLLAQETMLLQKFVSLADRMDAIEVAVDPALVLQCRIYAQRGAEQVMARAYLSIGPPLWFDAEAKLTLSDHARILLHMGLYKRHGGTSFAISTTQLDAALNAFCVYTPQAGQPNIYYEYSYWLYRPQDDRAEQLPDTATVAIMSAASMYGGRRLVHEDGVLKLLQHHDRTSPAAIYAFGVYLFG